MYIFDYEEDFYAKHYLTIFEDLMLDGYSKEESHELAGEIVGDKYREYKASGGYER